MKNGMTTKNNPKEEAAPVPIMTPTLCGVYTLSHIMVKPRSAGTAAGQR